MEKRQEYERLETKVTSCAYPKIESCEIQTSAADYLEIGISDNLPRKSYTMRRIEKQIQRDLLYLGMLKDIFPLDYIPL